MSDDEATNWAFYLSNGSIERRTGKKSQFEFEKFHEGIKVLKAVPTTLEMEMDMCPLDHKRHHLLGCKVCNYTPEGAEPE